MTLDVSKLSGWLNAFVSCRVEREGMGSKARCEQGKARVHIGGARHERCAPETCRTLLRRWTCRSSAAG